jgi:DNA-binding IclR family transcriptional regulator
MLAYLPDDQRRRALETIRLTARTSRTITSRSAFVAELDQVRRQGFAENRGESQVGMCSIAAPVRDRMGRVVASVSVAEHVDDVDAGLRHLAGPVIETAKRVSAGLGWTW